MKESVGKIMVQIGQTQGEEKLKYLTKESTLFNTHTKEFVEGYADENSKNELGIGLSDFSDKMVLRFKNEKELSLYFDAVDHLAQVIILKGQRVLLEKEHYGEIMEKFLTLNKNYLGFLCDEGEE